jgi:hypothetical protein
MKTSIIAISIGVILTSSAHSQQKEDPRCPLNMSPTLERALKICEPHIRYPQYLRWYDADPGWEDCIKLEEKREKLLTLRFDCIQRVTKEDSQKAIIPYLPEIRKALEE